ncbi:class II fructose-bisphosphatase [Brevibacillus fluminis]|uniref:class II fructose-bisphosphatase n=1 Tax=Brevibacillus fluminis TaxID=511487 RepID=UPI003F8BAB92
MMKQLLLDFVGVTEAAALASVPWIGRGKKLEADGDATAAMRRKLNQMQMDAVIVIGEGELDEAPMLHIGERVGAGNGPALDIAVDPLEGTNLVMKGQGNSIAVIAAAPRGCLLHAPDMYMEKLAVGPKAAGKIDITAPLLDNLHAVAKANGKRIDELTVMVQERERHAQIIQTIQQAGARVQLFGDGDVSYTVATAIEHTGIDMLVGIGGAPEAVVSAAALHSLGGEIQGRLLPSNQEEYDRCLKMGIADPLKPLRQHDFIRSHECLFAATGITDGLLLQGVRLYEQNKQITHSLVTYKSDTPLHFIESVHEQRLTG